MATYYWGNVAGNWTEAKWSTTSNAGPYDAGPPTASDDAVFNASSTATCTISFGSVCNSLVMTGAAGQINGTAALTISGKDGSNQSMVLGGTVTYSGIVTFTDTSGTTNAITMAGKTSLTGLTFNGSGGVWQFQDAVTLSGNAVINLTRGTLLTNNQNVSASWFSCSGTLTRALTLGTTSWSNLKIWEVSGSGYTVSAASSTLTIDPAASTVDFTGAGQTYGTWTFTPTVATVIRFLTSATFSTLTLNAQSAASVVKLTGGTTLTVTGTFTSTGNISTNSIPRPAWMADPFLSTATISAATVSISYSDFMSVVGTGAGSWSGTSIGNGGNNTGFSFAGSVTRYWVGTSGGEWNSTASWSTSSGGASGASVPLAHDDVVINASSITSTGRTFSVTSILFLGRNIDSTGVLNAPKFSVLTPVSNSHSVGSGTIVTGSFTVGSTVIAITGSWCVKGDFTGGAGLNSTSTGVIDLCGFSGTQIVNLGSTASNNAFYVDCGGTVQLQSTFQINNQLRVLRGTLDVNSQFLTVAQFLATGSDTRAIINPGSVWTLTGTIFNVQTTTGLTASWPSTVNHTPTNPTFGATFTGNGSYLVTSNFALTSGSGNITFSAMKCDSFDLSSWTGTVVTGSLYLTGDFTGGPSMSTSSTLSLNMVGTSGTQLLTMNSTSSQISVYINGVGGTVELQDTFVSLSSIYVTAGTLDGNDMDVTTSQLTLQSSVNSILNMRSGTWTITGAGTVWVMGTSSTVNSHTSQIVLNNSSASTKYFTSNGTKTYNSVLFSGTGTGIFIVGGSNTTFGTLAVDTPPHTLTFTPGLTYSIGTLSISGTDASHMNTINTTSAGSFATFNGTAGDFSCDWIVLKDNHLTGVFGAYGQNSTYQTGNSGWSTVILGAASPLTTGSPVLGTPVFDLVPATPLYADDSSTGSPVIDAALLNQYHVILGSSIATGPPVVDPPAIVQYHYLTAAGISVGSPSVGDPVFYQKNILTAVDFSTSSPVFGSVVVSEMNFLSVTGSGIETGSPVIDSPEVGGSHSLYGTMSVEPPVIGSPEIGQEHELLSGDSTASSPEIDEALLYQTHVVFSEAAFTSSPSLGSPGLVGNILYASDLLTGSPELGSPVMRSALEADPVVLGSPELGAPELLQSHSLSTTSISVGSPSAGLPEVDQEHELLTNGLATSSPEAGGATLMQRHYLSTVDVAVESASIGTPSIGQTSFLSAESSSLTSPVFGSPVLLQRHVLGSVSIYTSSPSLGVASFLQAEELEADDCIAGSPVLQSPVVRQSHELTGEEVSTGSPSAGDAEIDQTHVLSSPGYSSDSPSTGSPSVGQEHDLAADGLSSPGPSVVTPVLRSIHLLSPDSIAVAELDTGTAYLSQTLTADSISNVSPEIGETEIGQNHHVEGSYLSVSELSNERPVFSQGAPFFIPDFSVGSPVIGTPYLMPNFKPSQRARLSGDKDAEKMTVIAGTAKPSSVSGKGGRRRPYQGPVA